MTQLYVVDTVRVRDIQFITFMVWCLNKHGDNFILYSFLHFSCTIKEITL